MEDTNKKTKKNDSSKIQFEEERYTIKKTNPAVKAVIFVFLGIWAFINLFPIYFMFTFSLKSNEEIFGKNVIGLPNEWLWSNYAAAMKTGNMGLYFLNSVLVTVAATAITVIAGLSTATIMEQILRFMWAIPSVLHLAARFVLLLMRERVTDVMLLSAIPMDWKPSMAT